MDTDLCRYVAMDSETAVSTMLPGSRANHSQKAIPLHPESPVPSSFTVLKLFHFSFSSI